MANISLYEYNQKTKQTAVYPHDGDKGIIYTIIGLGNESGQALGKLKKYLRGDYDVDKLKELMVGQLGDCFFYLIRAIDELGLDPYDIINENINKLFGRMQRGVIQGDGDNR